MVGLRERKKKKTRRAILDAARELFVQQGFGATTMERIADAAEVGVGTLYNYFDSKNALLLALGESLTQDVYARGAKILAAPPDGPCDAVVSLLQTYMESILGFPTTLLRELFAATLGPSRDSLAEPLLEQDYRLVGQLAQMLAQMQTAGHIRSDLDIDDVALLLYGVLFVPLFLYIMQESTELEACRQLVERHAILLFDGLSPKRGR